MKWIQNRLGIWIFLSLLLPNWMVTVQSQFCYEPLAEAGQAASPQIEIRANGYLIPNGDTTPSTSDNTDMGTVRLGYRSREYFFTIRNIGNATLRLTGSPTIQLVGNNSTDFSVISLPKTELATNESTSFSIVFEPQAEGYRKTTVHVPSNDPNCSVYSFTIQGYGSPSTDDDSKIRFSGSCRLNPYGDLFSLGSYGIVILIVTLLQVYQRACRSNFQGTPSYNR